MVELAREGVLIGCPSVVCYLNFCSFLRSIIEKIEIGASAETMMLGLGRRRREVVVYIGEAVPLVSYRLR